MKKMFLLPIALGMVLSFITWGCEDEEEDAFCEAFTSPECSELSFNACSDENGDYYENGDVKYYCSEYYEDGDEDECDGAADQLILDSGCVSSSESSASLKSATLSYKSFVLSAMAEVRTQAKFAAGCN
ncbi:hypothetical protein [Saccharicrinis fermentans]|uniref:Lipoprotein n=1 Tax=Saccharicrinis fermentans DSM 9555 = JCM 21142 TaxID=869213 RepID=W7YGR5_9BACT|nr:hypothetical protein [Saccharicrinis fermentans]GAF03566.1 hypothetical protein JCM21142_52244 [Saccharicrinis fermentans DSM 9555 = JCM 21142]